MIAKLFGMFDRLVAAQDDDGMFINLLAGGAMRARLNDGEARLTTRSSLPWRGRWSATVERAAGILLRVPDWLSAPAWRIEGWEGRLYRPYRTT